MGECPEEDEEPTHRLQRLEVWRSGLHGPQVRIKTDNASLPGENREGMSNADRGTVPGLPAVIPQRPLPTLAKEERKSVTSGESGLTEGGESVMMIWDTP